MAKRILIVDDEPDILEILRFNLEMEDYEVFTAESPDESERIVNGKLSNGQCIDLILLDVMMTPKSGFEWAKELKSDPRTANIPIIFCTAKTTENDLLTGFGLGSDDYICKPFRISEVKARVKAVLRRSSTPDPAQTEETNTVPAQQNIISFCIDGKSSGTPEGARKGLILDLDRKECTVDGEIVPFTKLEFGVLELLLSSPGKVFSREKILRKVWPDDTIVLDRTVDVNITRIRKKIGRYGDYLRTRFGYGYLFEK